ncbi:hypothetical protein C8Q74DRAFT_1192743 [Fomes fomentarius]|nr:hypothetical protein C8Q74DRAFT_1192743 [Fomes fomentarius]
MLRFTLPFLLLTIAYLPSPTMAIPFNPGLLPYGWFTEYECAIDTPSRVFVNIQSNDMGNNNTAFLCTRKCEYNGFVVAGVEATNWCYCGTGLVPSLPQPAPATDCSQPCTGDPNRSCGNHWRIQVCPAHSKLPHLPFGWFATVECAVDLPRVFANVIGVETPQNTAFSCTQYCQAHGYTYAGVEAMDWCLCGTDIAIAPTPAPLTDCDLACSGDPNRSCGGPWRIQVRDSTRRAVSVRIGHTDSCNSCSV